MVIKTRTLKDIFHTIALRELPPHSIALLYGSRARGDNNEDSDWDILIVLDKESIEWEDYNKYSYPFVEAGFETEQAVIPILKTKQEWIMNRNTDFYRNVIKDGVSLL